jgi:hypothetical protein
MNKFHLTIRCPKGKVTDKEITPPLITVPLQEGCSAYSDHFTLTPIYTIPADTEIPQLGKTKSASGIFSNWVSSINLSIEMCLIDSNFSGSLMDERRDYYAVTKGFPLVSAPVAESKFYYFKGANASAPMYQDEVKWPIYHTDKEPRLYLQYTNTNTPPNPADTDIPQLGKTKSASGIFNLYLLPYPSDGQFIIQISHLLGKKEQEMVT